jgi:hypothetical protein
MTQPKSDVTWENPPESRGTQYDWAAIAEKLRRNPMEWAKVFDNDRTSLATAIRIKGIQALHPDKGFEVKTANNIRFMGDDGKEKRRCTLYLRYNPEKVKN